MRTTHTTRRQMLSAMLAAPAALALGCNGEGDGASAEQDIDVLTDFSTPQERCDRFYDLANPVTIRITMDPAEWAALVAELPAGQAPNGPCNWDYVGDRFVWRVATSVEISGPVTGSMTFSNVGIKKKSFCGSADVDGKPSFKLDLAKYVATNKAAAEGFIGTQYVTLNNSKQDGSYARQVLGYQLYRLAGLPYSRCNFAWVYVNGVQIGSAYVNIEAVRQRYIERHFNGNVRGNLYELELDDIVAERIPYIDVESLSAFESKLDLAIAADHLAQNGIAGMADVVDVAQFIKVFAMEGLLKHWDGYAAAGNNTYIYNDVTAVAFPGFAEINLKLIPWGIDQILQDGPAFYWSGHKLLARLVRDDPAQLAALRAQVRIFQQTVFDRTVQSAVITPFIDRVQNILTSAGPNGESPVLGSVSGITSLRAQIELANSAACLFAGFPASAVSLLDKDTGHALRSTTQLLAGSSTETEIIHAPRTGAASEQWIASGPALGALLFKQSTGLMLVPTTVTSTAPHHLLAGTKFPVGKVNTFTPVPEIVGTSSFTLTGYARFRAPSQEYLRFATDDFLPGSANVRVDLAPLAEASLIRVG